MKKLLAIIILGLSGIMMSAQTIELHQTYDNEGAFGSTRLLMEYYWTSDNEDINFYVWNSYAQDGISGLFYCEYLLGANIYLHGEVRAQMGNFSYNTLTPQIGLAYLLPIPCDDLGIYIVPKFSYKDINYSKHDFQLSINSSYENDYLCYDGYIDSNWIKGMSIFAEQKVLYKMTDHFQFGVNLVFETYKPYKLDCDFTHLQPFLVARVAF